MKFGFLVLILLSGLLLGIGFAQAGDVSCQVDLLKPKINAAVILEEANKPAKLTVAEARLRLQKSQVTDDTEPAHKENGQVQNGQVHNGQVHNGQVHNGQVHNDHKETTQETAQTNDEKETAKAAKKPSRLGGIFDILLPSKLRNPVK